MTMAATGETAAVSRTERFFRWVWRINGLVLLIALAGVVIGLSSLLLNEWGRSSSRDTPVAEAPHGELHLGNFAPVDGTTLFTAPLLDGQGRASGFSGSGDHASMTRNVLVYDSANGSSHWLLADHDGALCEVTHLRNDDTSTHPPLGWAWTARDAAGRYHISMADAAGGRAQALLDADDCFDRAYAQDGRAIIFFNQQGKPAVSVVDIATRQVLRTDALPEPQVN